MKLGFARGSTTSVRSRGVIWARPFSKIHKPRVNYVYGCRENRRAKARPPASARPPAARLGECAQQTPVVASRPRSPNTMTDHASFQTRIASMIPLHDRIMVQALYPTSLPGRSLTRRPQRTCPPSRRRSRDWPARIVRIRIRRASTSCGTSRPRRSRRPACRYRPRAVRCGSSPPRPSRGSTSWRPSNSWCRCRRPSRQS